MQLTPCDDTHTHTHTYTHTHTHTHTHTLGVTTILVNECRLVNAFISFLHQSPEEFNYYPSFLVKDSTRRAIHVGNLTYNNGVEVEKHLLNVSSSLRPRAADSNAGHDVHCGRMYQRDLCDAASAILHVDGCCHCISLLFVVCCCCCCVCVCVYRTSCSQLLPGWRLSWTTMK